MQERKIFVFGGWDTPVCYNDMYMLDLGEGHTLSLTSCLLNTETRVDTRWVDMYALCSALSISDIFLFPRSDGVFQSENIR